MKQWLRCLLYCLVPFLVLFFSGICKAELIYLAAESGLNISSALENVDWKQMSYSHIFEGERDYRYSFMAGMMPISFYAIEIEGRVEAIEDIKTYSRLAFTNTFAKESSKSLSSDLSSNLSKDLSKDLQKNLSHNSPKINILLNNVLRLSLGPLGLFAGFGICLHCMENQNVASELLAISDLNNIASITLGAQKFLGLQIKMSNNLGIFLRITNFSILTIDWNKRIIQELVNINSHTQAGLGMRVMI